MQRLEGQPGGPVAADPLDDGSQPERLTPAMRARRSGPLVPEETPVIQDETVVGGTKAKPGRTYRIRGYPRS